MKLHHIRLTKQQLDQIPEAERRLLILAAHAANELSTLTKLFHFCTKHAANSQLEKEALSAQGMALGRVLTGKLYECWVLLRGAFFATQVSKSYEGKFDEQSTDALTSLKKYFGGKNLISTVRNSHAFHYDVNQIAVGYQNVAPEEPLNIYMAETNANTLYAFADVIANRSMTEGIVAGDPAKAIDCLIVETGRVTAWLNQVIAACMLIAITTYLGESLEVLGAKEIEIDGAPGWNEVTVPYFVEIADGEMT